MRIAIFNNLICWEEFLILPFYLLIVYFVAKKIKRKYEKKISHDKNIDLKVAYKYFIPGLFFKIAGGIAFTLIHCALMPGDTVSYFYDSVAVKNVIFKDLGVFFSIMFGNNTPENFQYYYYDTSFSLANITVYSYYFKGGIEFLTIRLFAPFSFFGMGYFLPTVVLVNTFFFAGIWKFFLIFSRVIYPKMEKQIAIASLFIPSILFWGSGIMKDTITLSCSLWILSNIYFIFIKRKDVLQNIIILIINSWLVLQLKGYIFIAIIPPAFIWIFYNKINKIKNKAFQRLISPIFIVAGLLVGVFFISLLTESLGAYSLENVQKKAEITQLDFTNNEAYGDNKATINVDFSSPAAMLKSVPEGLMLGLFRPYLWEARGFTTIISGIENFFFLIFAIYIIFLKVGVFRTIKYIFSEPLLIFSLIFILIFATAVGLTTPIFGTLVRYRIPAIPFLFLLLFVLYRKGVEIKKEKLLKKENLRKWRKK